MSWYRDLHLSIGSLGIPGGPGVGTPHCHCLGPGFCPGWGFCKPRSAANMYIFIVSFIYRLFDLKQISQPPWARFPVYIRHKVIVKINEMYTVLGSWEGLLFFWVPYNKTFPPKSFFFLSFFKGSRLSWEAVHLPFLFANCRSTRETKKQRWQKND